MRSGIERYLKTYPQDRFWSGKNYLFDKRMEQLPELKPSTDVEKEVATTLNANCCVCRKPWTTYRGQHKCSQIQCGVVPVLVCDACDAPVMDDLSILVQKVLLLVVVLICFDANFVGKDIVHPKGMLI